MRIHARTRDAADIASRPFSAAMTLSIRASATRHDHGRPISRISTKEARCVSSTRTRVDGLGRSFVFTRWVCARCRSLLDADLDASSTTATVSCTVFTCVTNSAASDGQPPHMPATDCRPLPVSSGIHGIRPWLARPDIRAAVGARARASSQWFQDRERSDHERRS